MSVSLPFVSFVVPCYNQEPFIRDAIAGAFAQDYPSLEILISDDGSRDRTFEIARQMVDEYRGPHQVRCIRSEVNCGIAAQVNKLSQLAQGELIVVAAGDDISLPDRTSKLVAAYLASAKTVHYLYSSAREMRIDGDTAGVLRSPGGGNAGSALWTGLSNYPLAIGATQAWTKVLVNTFPPIGPHIWADDQILGFRGILIGPVICIDEPLVQYRVGSGISTKKRSFSFRSYFTGKRAGIEIFMQRCADAAHVRKYPLAFAVGAKSFLLIVLVPVAPFLSAVKRLRKT